jgi:hypothetical protein
MRIFLFILCFLSFMSGAGYMSSGTSAIHQILAGVFLLMAAVLLCGAGIIEAINQNAKAAAQDNSKIIASLKRLHSAQEAAGPTAQPQSK